jgi:uncharacterized protein YbjT (DUF2867 family)
MKVILFGATGMVGAGILLECLDDPRVESVLTVGRKPSGVQHARVRDLVRADLYNYADVREQLRGYDTCFFALGISVVGLDEAAYTQITHDIPLAAATVLAELNPKMTFCFVSGAGADSSGRARAMWARVKGRTENDLLAMPLNTYVFRPGLIQPRRGVTSKTGWYNVFYTLLAPLYPLLRATLGGIVTATDSVGIAMIHVAAAGDEKRIIETSDINRIAARGSATPAQRTV